MRFCGTRNSHSWEAFLAKPDFRKADSDSLCILELLESALYNFLNVHPWLYLQVWKMIKPCFPRINAKKTHQICAQNRRNKMMDFDGRSQGSTVDIQYFRWSVGEEAVFNVWLCNLSDNRGQERAMFASISKQARRSAVNSVIFAGPWCVNTAQRHSLQKTNTHTQMRTQSHTDSCTIVVRTFIDIIHYLHPTNP